MNLSQIYYDEFKKAFSSKIKFDEDKWANYVKAIEEATKKPKKVLTDDEIAIQKEKRLLAQKEKNEKKREFEQLKEDSKKYHELRAQMDNLKISFD